MQFLIEAFTLMTAKNSPFIPLSRIKNRILIWVLVHDCLLGTLTPPGWVNCKWQPLFSTVTSCLCWAQISYVTIFKQRRLVCLRVGVGRKVCSAYCWRCTFLRAANSSSSVSVCFFLFHGPGSKHGGRSSVIYAFSPCSLSGGSHPNCSSQTTIAGSSPDRKWMHSVCVVRPLVPHPAVSFILMRSSFPWRTSSGSILDAFSIWLSGCFSLLLLLLSLKRFQHYISSDNLKK